MSIAVVLPCYRVRDKLLPVVCSIGPEVHRIYVVDDGCPENSVAVLDRQNVPAFDRLRILKNSRNLGVGGAVKAGYEAALRDGNAVVVKLDGDGQMDPALLSQLVKPILAGQADYCKGNRFNDGSILRAMPPVRLLGNAALSFLTRFSHGYWHIMDPTNGYTAIAAHLLRRLPLARIADGYFFESDMLFQIGLQKARVLDIPMPAIYGDEKSSLNIPYVMLTFPWLIAHRTWQRLSHGLSESAGSAEAPE